MSRPFDDHEPHCRRDLRIRGFSIDDPRVDEECRCNARWIELPPRTGGVIDVPLVIIAGEYGAEAQA